MEKIALDLIENMVSVVIPAYNQPVNLRRALTSVIEQTYRPIEVIVADDCSPNSLEPVVKEFLHTESEVLKIRYCRHTHNRGVAENFRFCFAQASGKYAVLLPHDNRLIDRAFLNESVEIMIRHSDCHLCYGNAIYDSSHRLALKIPDGIAFNNGWAVLEGKDFIRHYLQGGMGWSQAMVLDHQMALELKAYDEPFVVNEAVSRRLGIAQDDIFSYVFLLSSAGSVALCEKLVGEIGTPAESYSRSNRFWKETKGKVKFVIFFNISCADLKGPYTPHVKRAAFKLALKYADRIFDWRIAKYYDWSPKIIFLMGFSLIKSVWNELRFLYKRAVNVLKPNTFTKTKR